MAKNTQPVHVPRDVLPVIRANAKEKDITIGESVRDLVTYAMNRKAALAKDQEKRQKKSE